MKWTHVKIMQPHKKIVQKFISFIIHSSITTKQLQLAITMDQICVGFTPIHIHIQDKNDNSYLLPIH